MSVQPYQIHVSDQTLADLHARLATTALPPDDDASDWDAGTSPAYLRALLDHWRTAYDWRAHEARLGALAHFRVELGDTFIHFIHERGRGPAPLPLLLTHGFPDSFLRFMKLIPLLTDPGAHGGDPADAFDVVVPSLPGYGFSGRAGKGADVFHIADRWHELMLDVLGYQRYGAHGGDWGSTITEHLGRSHADALVGIDLTDVPFWHTFRKPDDLSPEEQRYFAAFDELQRKELGYAMMQSTRPQTLADGLIDSPAGLAAWIVQLFQRMSDCHGDLDTRFSKDELLTNIMLYWVTGTIGTAFRPYADLMHAGALRWIAEATKSWLGSSVPAGFALFPAELSHPPRAWAARFFDVARWTVMPRGGHFAALEEPGLLAADLRAFFRPLRPSS